MKKWMLMALISLLFLVPALAQAQPGKMIDRFFGRGGSSFRPDDLRVVQLEFSPDPVRQGQRLSFRITVVNQSRDAGRVDFIIRDQDEIIAEAIDVNIHPGENRIVFPEAAYRFSRSDHCFIVEADIERTRRPIDLAREFCARRTESGWTLSDRGVGPLFVEDLDMNPDPAMPGQDIRFKVTLRNDGRPVRGDIRIHDRDQLVVRVDNVLIPRGQGEFQFPFTRYSFQRSDHCFKVLVDIDRTPHPIDAAREFCARPLGWTLGR